MAKTKRDLKKLRERVFNALIYDKKTGLFFWRVKPRYGVNIGDKAGCYSDGYWLVKLDGVNYLAHRLAWFYVYGYFPESDIDHINQNKMDNRIENLREVSHQCNMRNCGPKNKNRHGVKGVRYHKGKWQAYIGINGRQIHGGSFDDVVEAACMRLALEQCFGFPGCDNGGSTQQYVCEKIGEE